MSNQTNELKNMMASFFQMNTASSSGSGLLPSNTIANPRGDLKAITTQSGVSYDGPPIPSPFSSLPKVVERVPKVTKDTVQPSTENIQPLLHFDLSFANALLRMPKFATMFKSLLNNKEKLFDLSTTLVNENCSAVILKKLTEKLGDPDKFLISCDFQELVECLALVDLAASINLMPLFIWEKLSLPELTPMQMILELADRLMTRPAGIAEDVFMKVGKFHFPIDFVVIDYVVDHRIEACLARKSIPSGIDDTDSDPEGDNLLIEKLLNNDPSSPLPLKELNLEELKTIKSFIDDPPELELKDLPSHLEYLLTRKTKRRPPSLALMEHLSTDEMMEVFMDDFSVFGDSFSSCLTYLDKMLKLCEDINLVLN
nr:reverse transcriptase domain-containing protein [Tanacetum cinerariifolium]